MAEKTFHVPQATQDDGADLGDLIFTVEIAPTDWYGQNSGDQFHITVSSVEWVQHHCQAIIAREMLYERKPFDLPQKTPRAWQIMAGKWAASAEGQHVINDVLAYHDDFAEQRRDDERENIAVLADYRRAAL